MPLNVGFFAILFKLYTNYFKQQTESLKHFKEYIPVEIPTKKYIRGFIISELGEKPIFDRQNKYGRHLVNILESKRNPCRTEFARYNTKLKIYIPLGMYKAKGCNLNHTNIKDFNLYIEDDIKQKFYMFMDYFIECLPSFKGNLPQVRKKLGINENAWSDDSMKKDYYRYRKAAGKPLLYTSVLDRQVPTKYNHDFAF